MTNRFVLASRTSSSGLMALTMESDKSPGRDNSFCGDQRREKLWAESVRLGSGRRRKGWYADSVIPSFSL